MLSCRKLLVLCLVTAICFSFVPTVWAQEVEKININQASVEELTKLKNIGPGYAERIKQYRKEHGPFEEPADIMKVKGIGSATFEANKDRITVE